MGTRLNSQDDVLLKSDVFGTITRAGETVVRDARAARPWARVLARHLMRREHRALTRLALGSGVEGIPRALTFEPARLTRSWIEGAPMQIAKPRNRQLFPRRRAPAAPPARRERHSQRSRQGDQLAGDAGRPPRTGGFPARDDTHEARTAGARARSRRHPPPAQAQAQLPARASHRSREAHSRHAVAGSRASGWRAASRSIYLSHGRYSAGAIARAPAIGASARKPAHIRRGRIWIL